VFYGAARRRVRNDREEFRTVFKETAMLKQAPIVAVSGHASVKVVRLIRSTLFSPHAHSVLAPVGSGYGSRSAQEGQSMRGFIAGAMLGAVLLIVAPPRAAAHHAFSAEFDANRPVKLTGTVTRMEWINPHAWIHIDVAKPDGSVEQWMIEGGTPNTLLRRGFTKESLKAGTVIVVDGFQSKDGRLRANGRDLTLPDGRTLFVGSSNTGAPTDGKDPGER